MAVIPKSMVPAAHLAARASQASRTSSQYKVALAIGVTIPILFLIVCLLGLCILRRRSIAKAKAIENEGKPSSISTTVAFDSLAPNRRAPYELFDESRVSRWSELPGSSVPDEFSEPVSLKRRHYLGSLVPRLAIRTAQKSHIGKGKERLHSDQILGSDKRSTLQDLTAPQVGQSSHLRVAPVDIGTVQGPLGNFVNPWDVEYHPNPVHFSHLKKLSLASTISSPIRAVEQRTTSEEPPRTAVSTSSETLTGSEARKTLVQTGLQILPPYEMDAMDSEYNPWIHSPITAAKEVPHRWEKTLGCDRMFFEAEHDMFPFPLEPDNNSFSLFEGEYNMFQCQRKRSQPDHPSSPDPSRQRRKGATSKKRRRASEEVAVGPNTITGAMNLDLMCNSPTSPPESTFSFDTSSADIEFPPYRTRSFVSKGKVKGRQGEAGGLPRNVYSNKSGHLACRRTYDNDILVTRYTLSGTKMPVAGGISLDRPRVIWCPDDAATGRPFRTATEPVSATEGIDWSLVDSSFARQIVASHCQQVKFFTKFCNHISTPLSTSSTRVRGELSLDGGSSLASTPTPSPSPTSIRSLGSPVAAAITNSSQASSISLTTQANESIRSFESISSATTVSIDELKQTSITQLQSFNPVTLTAQISQSSLSRATTSSAVTASVEELEYTCFDCDRKFKTLGQRRNHYNRKHNLRYKCTLCPKAFGLQLDLDRHERTVHEDYFPSRTGFVCTKIGCATPGKKFNRKDNFKRHVKRCGEAVGVRGQVP